MHTYIKTPLFDDNNSSYYVYLNDKVEELIINISNNNLTVVIEIMKEILINYHFANIIEYQIKYIFNAIFNLESMLRYKLCVELFNIINELYISNYSIYYDDYRVYVTEIIKRAIEYNDDNLMNYLENNVNDSYNDLYQYIFTDNIINRINIKNKQMKKILQRIIKAYINSFNNLSTNNYELKELLVNFIENEIRIDNIDDIFNNDYPVDRSELVNQNENIFNVLKPISKIIIIDSIEAFKLLSKKYDNNGNYLNNNFDVLDMYIVAKRYNSINIINYLKNNVTLN